MPTIRELGQERAQRVDEMNSILQRAEQENRNFSDSETARWVQLDGEQDAIEKRIKLAAHVERLSKAQGDYAAPQDHSDPKLPKSKVQDTPDPVTGFCSLGELVYTQRYRPQDERLQTMEMGTGASGGIAVPKVFRDQLLEVATQKAVIRPLAEVIPAGDKPDAEVTFPALDQSSTNGVRAGVSVNWVAEGVASTASDANLREVTLKPNEVCGHVIVTNKLLENWMAATSVIQRLLGDAMTGAEDLAFQSGNGVGKPLGILNAGAAIAVNRAGATAIALADVIGMRKKALGDLSGYVWLASDDTIDKLMTLKDEASNLVWLPSARDGEPDRLLGRPVIVNERGVDLGSKGDLMLVDLSHYLIKDGSGPFLDTSPHVYFTTRKTVVQVSWSVDGQPWLESAHTNEGGRTRSPFVILDVPS